MANPTVQVPTESTRFDDDKVYWPLDTTNTSDVLYNGEMMGMKFSTGYANHFDDSTPMAFLGTKEGIIKRLQSDTPLTDFKELIRKPKFIAMPLTAAQANTATIPGSIGQPAFAADSGHVQIGTAGLTNNNFAGLVVDIGRSQSTGGGTGGINSLTGPTSTGSSSVVLAPPVPGALSGLYCQGYNAPPNAATTGANAPNLSILGGAGGNATVIGNGGTGASIVLQPGLGGTSSTATAGSPGAITHAGPVRSPYSGTQTMATGSTITLPTLGTNVFLNNTAATTGLILSPGRFDGDGISLTNIGTNTATFAASGTSNVALGTGAAIVTLARLGLVWSVAKQLWF